MKSWALRARSFVVDFVLVGAAVSYASDVVQAWLLAHVVALAWILGALHLAMLPLLTVSIITTGGPGSQALESTPASKVLVWSHVLYFGIGWLVPFIVALRTDVGAPFALTTIFGPFALTILAVWLAAQYDKRHDYALSRMGSKPPRAFVRAIVFAAWAYLLCVEAALMVASRGHDVFSGMGTVACAFVAYLPIRVYLAFAFDARRWELVAMAFAFLHFLYRLAS